MNKIEPEQNLIQQNNNRIDFEDQIDHEMKIDNLE